MNDRRPVVHIPGLSWYHGSTPLCGVPQGVLAHAGFRRRNLWIAPFRSGEFRWCGRCRRGACATAWQIEMRRIAQCPPLQGPAGSKRRTPSGG